VSDVRGIGEFIAASGRRGGCRGGRFIEEPQELAIHEEPGMRDGDRLIFHGAGDEAPGAITRDIVIVVREVGHPVFKRDGDELFVHKDIMLTQALVGFEFARTHLDGRILLIKSEAGSVVLSEDVKVVVNEGMPIRGNVAKRGKLFVSFGVVFPVAADLSPALKERYERALPAPNELAGIDMEDENTYMAEMRDSEIAHFEQARFTEDENEVDRRQQQGHRSSCRPM
jgi:DnaJ family protein A protein 2